MPSQISAYLCHYEAKLLNAMPITSHCFATTYRLFSVPVQFHAELCHHRSLPYQSRRCHACASQYSDLHSHRVSTLCRCRAYLCESFASPCQACALHCFTPTNRNATLPRRCKSSPCYALDMLDLAIAVPYVTPLYYTTAVHTSLFRNNTLLIFAPRCCAPTMPITSLPILSVTIQFQAETTPSFALPPQHPAEPFRHHAIQISALTTLCGSSPVR